MSNNERIITEVGVTVPRINRAERFSLRIFLQIIELYAKMRERNNIDLVQEFTRGIRTIADISEDFDKGKIQGEVVPDQGQPYFSGAESFRLFTAKANSKNLKKSEFSCK